MVRWTWELRRLKSDLTMMFSIIRGFVDIDFDSVYMRGHNRTVVNLVINAMVTVNARSRVVINARADMTVRHEHCNVNCRLNAFVCGNINAWNRLPAHVVNSDSVAVFKQLCKRRGVVVSGVRQ